MPGNESKIHENELELRTRLDDIGRFVAQALASLDSNPDPEKLDNLVPSYCRICRLIWERARSVAAFAERDPNLLDVDTTRDVISTLLTDVEKHQQMSMTLLKEKYPKDPDKWIPHDPMTRALVGLFEYIGRRK